jgi:hypothetical protein
VIDAQNKAEVRRDAGRLRLFREAAHRFVEGKHPASEMKVMNELYEAMGTSTRYSAEIFSVELMNKRGQQ